MKMSYKNNKFKISGPVWNEKFELGYFEYITKKQDTLVNF